MHNTHFSPSPFDCLSYVAVWSYLYYITRFIKRSCLRDFLLHQQANSTGCRWYITTSLTERYLQCYIVTMVIHSVLEVSMIRVWGVCHKESHTSCSQVSFHSVIISAMQDKQQEKWKILQWSQKKIKTHFMLCWTLIIKKSCDAIYVCRGLT